MAAAKPKTMPDRQQYQALEPLLHDGDKYLPGQPIELTAEQAKSMQSRRLVTLVTAEADSEEGAE
ncbi:hypothetical protein [Oceanobacter mangrovi]|uniref:hypothetical protein n=1 Tax=Oceanobacter mangrovi TaxID=2862510 RepID=UPI001C8E219D|nr:hypothetical protein [Oceanobacter mangrovi]